MHGFVIGRERELAEGHEFLDEAAERSCGLLLVGEAGIGKTTIWSALTEEAVARGFDVLAARPSEAEQELAFSVLSDLFEQIDGVTLDELPPTQLAALEQALRRRETRSSVDPTAVALATLAAFRLLADSAPTLVAIDDLQWTDWPSLRALTFAYRRLGSARVGLVATTRSGFDVDLTRRGARHGNSLERIEIGGLGDRHLAELLFDRTGRTLSPPQLRRVQELSGGSPYYALELASTGDPGAEAPETLAAALRARLATLTEAQRAAATVAATLGRFDPDVLGVAHRDGVIELRRSGLVDDRSGKLRFAHPLLASTVLDLHTVDERRAVHLWLANVLEDPDERAMHVGRSTDSRSEAIAAELEAAAARVDARGAPETAAMLAERAAELTPESDTGATTRRLLLAADLYQAAGESSAHALPLLEQLAKTLPAGPDRARVFVRLGWLGAMMDTLSASEVVSFQERALAEAGATRDIDAAAHAVLARLLGNAGDYRAAHHNAELAVAAGDVGEANLMFPSPSGELGTARFFAGMGLDEGLFELGIATEATFERVREPYQSARLQRALALLYTGQLSRARDALLELLGISIELGRVRSTAGFVLHLIELEVRSGNLAQAELYAAEFVHLDRQLRGELSGEWYPSGLVALHLGRVEAARSILTAGIQYSRTIESTIWLAHQLWALGHLELALGNLAAARQALVPLPAMLRETGLGEWSVHPVHPDAIEVLVALGELEEAAALTAELEEYGRRLDRPWGLATAARSEALLAFGQGANVEALEAVERALEEHKRLDWPFERARTLLVAGAILRRAGRRRDAAGRLSEARSAFASLRNPLWLARVDAEEERLGGRRRSNGELTPTEARVAALAGEGLRNAEIAARLYVTPKTVEGTLSRVYRKLGVRSRTELAHRLSQAAEG